MTLLIVSVIQWRISLIHSAQKSSSPGGYRKNTFIDKLNSVLHSFLVAPLELNWLNNIALPFRQLPQVKKKGFIDKCHSQNQCFLTIFMAYFNIAIKNNLDLNM